MLCNRNELPVALDVSIKVFCVFSSTFKKSKRVFSETFFGSSNTDHKGKGLSPQSVSACAHLHQNKVELKRRGQLVIHYPNFRNNLLQC